MSVVLASEARPADARMTVAIGLVNNMPPKAAASTERQFCRLLAKASPDIVVRVHLFSLVDHAADRAYGGIADIERSALDGLIVTGARPTTPDLRDEPAWPRLARLIDLAGACRIPAVFSCLAAHAAALHLHDIRRRRLPCKLSGVVDCTRSETNHPIAAGLPPRWRVPHSRYNELPIDALAAHGYQILSTADAGADLFVYERRARFTFLQGHPEYEAPTLLREYHRDVGEFLSGASDDYPQIPGNYLGERACMLLERFKGEALRTRRPELLADFPRLACEEGLDASWHGIAVRFWQNWLDQVCAARPAAANPRAEAALVH